MTSCQVADSRLTPILCAMMNVQDFHRLGFDCIDNNVGKRSQWEFSCATPVSGPAKVRCGFQRSNALVNRADGRFGKLGIVTGEVILDIF
jgi:hypothetical protein